jgi:hypothetical protein
MIQYRIEEETASKEYSGGIHITTDTPDQTTRIRVLLLALIAEAKQVPL